MTTKTSATISIVAAVLLLCTAGCTTDTEALIPAAQSGDYTEVKKAIRAGADVQARNNAQQTAVEIAAQEENIEILELLQGSEAGQ